MAIAMGEMLLGTSGWDYPEWVGRVYPHRSREDRLRQYAGMFPIVEVNSTFYRLPPVPVAESWARRTPRGFRFAAKFPQTITHDRRLVDTGEELGRFLNVVRPLQEAGKFVAALLQLPPSLGFDPTVVRKFYESLPATLPVAVEFREPTWLSDASFELLREFRLSYVIVDEPHLPMRLERSGLFVYLRWHGHGSPLWYDYTYTAPELESWVPRLRALASGAEPVYGFFNNHFRGDAAVNCRTLTEMLGLPAPSWAPRLAA